MCKTFIFNYKNILTNFKIHSLSSDVFIGDIFYANAQGITCVYHINPFNSQSDIKEKCELINQEFIDKKLS